MSTPHEDALKLVLTLQADLAKTQEKLKDWIDDPACHDRMCSFRDEIHDLSLELAQEREAREAAEKACDSVHAACEVQENAAKKYKERATCAEAELSTLKRCADRIFSGATGGEQKTYGCICKICHAEDILRAENGRLREAILWALGEGDEFPPRPEGKGQFWWRTELRKRAALGSKDGEQP